MDRTAEAIRDGEQAALERHQAEVEMEQALIAQKQESAGNPGGIAEQADLGDNAHDDGSSVIRAGGVEDYDDAPANEGPVRNIELDPGERTFEGRGDHSLAELDNSAHAIENQ
jgi:hypothetical protein